MPIGSGLKSCGAVANVRLALTDVCRVFKALREKKNPAKPSPAHYMRIAQAIHFQETIPDFLNIFVGNYNADHPGRPPSDMHVTHNSGSSVIANTQTAVACLNIHTGRGLEVFVLNRALLSYCKALHLGKATAIFNLMHPHTSRLSYSTHTEVSPSHTTRSTTQLHSMRATLCARPRPIILSFFLQGLPEPLCEPDDDTYVIYMNLLDKIADLSYGLPCLPLLLRYQSVFMTLMSGGR